MKIFTLGLPYDMTECSIRDVIFFLLIYSVVCVALGCFVGKTNIKNNYLALIRSKGYSMLWHIWCGKVICMSAIITGLLLLAILCSNLLYKEKILSEIVWQSVSLWFLGCCIIGLFFVAMQNIRYGEALCFLIVMLVEAVSIFLSFELPVLSRFLFGNYIMLGRSNLYEANGYPFKLIVVINIIIIITFSLFGYRIVFRRNKK